MWLRLPDVVPNTPVRSVPILSLPFVGTSPQVVDTGVIYADDVDVAAMIPNKALGRLSTSEHRRP